MTPRERKGRKGRKERQYFLAAFAAFTFQGSVSWSGTLLADRHRVRLRGDGSSPSVPARRSKYASRGPSNAKTTSVRNAVTVAMTNSPAPAAMPIAAFTQIVAAVVIP